MMTLTLNICCSASIRYAPPQRGLDATYRVREENRMLNKLLPAAAVALLALSACDNKPTEVTSVSADPMAAEIANRAPVELPPAIKKEATFRCADNSLVYVTFFEGDKQALVRSTQTGTPVKLTAANAGDPLKADGYEMTGTVKAVTLTQPGKPKQLCDL